MFLFPGLPGAHLLYALPQLIDRLRYPELLPSLVLDSGDGAGQKVCVVQNFLPLQFDLMTLCKPRISDAPQKSVVNKSPVVNNDIASLD
jgi:hypothetical protein